MTETVDTETSEIFKTIGNLVQIVICLFLLWLIRKLKNAASTTKATQEESFKDQGSEDSWEPAAQEEDRSRERQKAQKMRTSSAPALMLTTTAVDLIEHPLKQDL